LLLKNILEEFFICLFQNLIERMGLKINLEKVTKELSLDNDSSLEELFNYYYPRLFNFSKSFLKVEDGIDDIIQEVFVKIWQNRKNITTPSTFNAFIFTITRNLLLNELRSRFNQQKTKNEIFKQSVAEEYQSFEPAEYQELKEKIDQIIFEMPARQKEIFQLSRTEGLSHKEIAEKLAISTKTVEYHITQSSRFLKEKLKSLGFLSFLWVYLFL
jgi:RNA polymerase sigma-70 factor (ECF subfamily)